MKLAIIDISSHSITMLVIESTTNSVIAQQYDGTTITNYIEEKTLTERGISKLCDCFNAFKSFAATQNVEKVLVISTAGLRYIKNYYQVWQIIKEKTDLSINLIDGKLEAYCDYLATKISGDDDSIMIDIGGGSIEIVDYNRNLREQMVSLDFGVLKLFSKFVSKIFPTESEIKDIKRYIGKKIAKLDVFDRTFGNAVLVGSNANAMYRLYADFFDINTAEIQSITYKNLSKLYKFLLAGNEKTALIMKNCPEKVNTILCSIVAFRTILKVAGCKNAIVSKVGVKEGYIIALEKGEVTYYDECKTLELSHKS